MRERLVFEIADRELDDGVLAMLGLDGAQILGAVGDGRKQLPRRQQLPLAIELRTRRTTRRRPPIVGSAICAIEVLG